MITEVLSGLLLVGIFADGWRSFWPLDWRGWLRVLAFGVLVGLLGAPLRPYL